MPTPVVDIMTTHYCSQLATDIHPTCLQVDRKKAVKYNWVQSDEKSEKVKDATRETLHKAAS